MSAPASAMPRAFGLAEDVGRGQQVERARARDQLDLEAVAHAGLFEVGAEGAVDQADGREVLHAGEAERDQALQELRRRS